MKHPKTTLMGVLIILGTLINAAIDYLKTSKIPDLTVLGVGLSTGWGFIKAADAPAEKPISPDDPCQQQPTRQINPLVLLALIPVFALSGCAWIDAHQAQINATLAVLESRAESIAFQVVISAATDQMDKQFKADFLDSVALGLRAHEMDIVTSEDVTKIVQIWSPSDGAQWQALAGKLGNSAGTLLQTNGQVKPAQIVEQIATGLNNAAASARTQ